MASGPITSWQIDEETMETVADFIFLDSTITAHGDLNHKIKRHLLLERKVMSNLNSILKSRDITCQLRSIRSKLWFFQYHIWMWQLNHIEGWVPKNWCFWTVVLEKTLESPLDCKEIQPVDPKGNQSWMFIGRTDAEAEAPILGHLMRRTKNWLIGKYPDAGKDWVQKEKGTTEDGIFGWHHWFNGYQFAQTPGDSEGQGSLACCSPRGRK